MMSASVLSGCVAANRLHIGPPSDTPSSRPAASLPRSCTARTSSMRSSSVGRCATRSDSPVPRLSNRISREKPRQPAEESRERRFVPEVLEVRHPSHHEDEVDRAAAQDLIGDVYVPAARVMHGERRGREGVRRITGQQRNGRRIRDRRDEPVTAPVRCLDNPRAPRIVTQCAPDFTDAHLERAVAEEHSRPDRAEEFVLTDELARAVRRDIRARPVLSGRWRWGRRCRKGGRCPDRAEILRMRSSVPRTFQDKPGG